MRYNIELAPAAERDLRKLERPVRRRLLQKLEALGEDPRPHGAEKLTAEELYGVRVGDYRILNDIRDRDRTVLALRVGDRKEIYKRR